ncbi:MAG TPA: ABC transporter permease [Thermoanaerobaculia bacterium]|nr:ABC transporter permease [Thermoanaerobaculia bacterium]
MTEAFRQLWRDLRSQKLRTFLTLFGIVWGTTAVSLLLAFGVGLKHQQIRRTKGLGDRIVIAWPGLTSVPYKGLGKGRKVRISEEDVDDVRAQATQITGISTEYRKELKVRLGARTYNVGVSGVNPFFGEVRNLIPQAGGRFLDPLDISGQRRVAFVGDKLATDMFGKDDPVGKTVFIQDTPFLVVGVQKKKIQNSSYGGRDSNKIYVPASTLRILIGQKYCNNLIFQPRPGLPSKEAIAEVRGILSRRDGFDPNDKEALSIWDTTEQFHFFDVFFLAFNLFLGILGVLTLIVGGIGVSNIMNVIVDERTKEIGIKMALGARERFVLRQLLVETLVLTGVGGAIGLLLSLAICLAVPANGLGDTIGRPELSPVIALVTAAVLGTIGFLAGYFPAKEASRLDPVVAMKL